MQSKTNPAHTLWYAAPARHWEEALPLGNGRIGAMVYGGTDTERIALNEDTLWTGHPSFYPLYGDEDTWEKARVLAHAHQYTQAEELLEKEFTHYPTQSYLPLGDMYLQYEGAEAEDYSRRLDLSTGMHCVEFSRDGVHYVQESLVSYPHQVMALHIASSVPGKIGFRLSLVSPLKGTVALDGPDILLLAECPNRVLPRGIPQEKAMRAYSDIPGEQGIHFAARARIVHKGGTLTADGNNLVLSHADEATVYFSVRTSFAGWNKLPVVEGKEFIVPSLRDMDAAVAAGWDAIRKAHMEDHQSLYSRCELHLGGGEEGFAPTDVRLTAHASGQDDLALYALLFHYGRYLTIASSRPGTQASNLQGIWNPHLDPPWNANYTININTEENYWMALPANLKECSLPMHELIRELCESGKRTAQVYYHAPGYCAHHNTDLWRLSTPVGNATPGCVVWAVWPMAIGWMLREFVEYEAYTQDEAFLRDTLYPYLKGCAEFYAAMLDEDDMGRLVFCPSTSPEHQHLVDGKTPCAIGETTAMTMAIVEDIFRELLTAAEKLDCAGALEAQVKEMLPRLRGLVLTPSGAVEEWAEEGMVPREVHHRHISHLYGLHPARLYSPGSSQAQAVRQSLLERGDGSTGWSMGWRVSQWARLKDGDHALKQLDKQLVPAILDSGISFTQGAGSYPNLLGSHPPFQIDGNFGSVSGIVEMLLQNTPNGPELLPALPTAWQNGSIRGLRAWGGLTVDIAWENGKLTQSNISMAD